MLFLRSVKKNQNIPAKLLALLFGLYMLTFSILPADYVFAARVLGLSADVPASCALISSTDEACSDLCGGDHEEKDESEGKLPPIVEEEDIYAHQPLEPFIYTQEQTVYFHSAHPKWSDNISTIPTPPPDHLRA